MRLSLKNTAARLFASVVRKRTRRRARQDSANIADLEKTLLDLRGGIDLASTWISRSLTFKALLQLDPSALYHSIAHVHRTAVRCLDEPVMRHYSVCGLHFHNDIRNTAEWAAYILGEHESGVRYWIDTVLEPGHAAIDLGANVGLLTLHMARRVGSKGRVIGVEPNPSTFSRLQQNVETNGLNSVCELHQLALGDSSGRTTLSVPRRNAGAASLGADRGADVDAVDVQVLPFSEWWNDIGRPRVRLVKIDVEGHELSVLKGMTRYLAEDRPTIVVEVTVRGREEHAQSLVVMLRELDYRITMVVNSRPYAVPLPKQLPKQVDILCMPAARAMES